MKSAKDDVSKAPTKRTPRGEGLKDDKKKLAEIVEALTNKKMTKQELAEKIGVDKILITEGVLLAAAKQTKNIEFIENLEPSSPGRTEVPPKYIVKKGLLIQPSHFKNQSVIDRQQYNVEFGEKGIITLTPKKDESAK